MLVIGYIAVGFWLFCFEKRKRRKKAEQYDVWFDKQVRQGLQEEKDRKFANKDSIDKIFDRYIDSNNIKD
jgi:hypothetical protein